MVEEMVERVEGTVEEGRSTMDEKLDSLWNELLLLEYKPLAHMTYGDRDSVVVLFKSNQDNLCVIDVLTGDKHLYRVLGDIRVRSPYNFYVRDERDNIYREYSDVCFLVEGTDGDGIAERLVERGFGFIR